MRIGNDIDGCQSDFMESCNLWAEITGQPWRFQSGLWNFYEKVGMDWNAFKTFCDEAADAGVLFSTPPLPGAVEANHRMKAMGHTMVFITDRTFGSDVKVSQELTISWLDKYGFYVDELYFSADKTIVHTDTFVEDKLENYDALINAAVDAYLIDKPWNNFGGPDARKRIKDVTEYANIVESVTERGYADLTLV